MIILSDNTATSGGGIFILDTDATLINLTVSGNTATAFGGGLLIIDYGYLEKQMKSTLQSVHKHKFSNILI